MGAHLRSSLWYAITLVLLIAGPLAAQTGSITGRVSDGASGAPLAGARVDLVNAAGQSAASSLSDREGQFRLMNVQAGSYTLIVSLIGYENRRVEGVQIMAGQTSMQAITLDAMAFELNPIIVSASKRQEKAIDAPASVAVVDSRAIAERPATSPTDHLRSVPGVDVATQGVQSSTVVVRGFNNIFSGSLHALTDNRIAGVPSLRVNLLQFIPTTNDDVQRMEVVLGPGAALYGPNTTDGVLHIITKSPLDYQETTASVAGGEQGLFQTAFRTSQLLSEKFGIKVSGQYLKADEWVYKDPVELTERANYDTIPALRGQLRNALGLEDDAAGNAEVDKRIARIATRDFELSRWSTDLRADWRVADDATVIFAGGLSHIANGIELTGLGGAQAKDWRYSYLQTRATWGRLFAQAYVNASDAGNTYLLRNGAPIKDRSRLYVAQAQHGFDLGERQSFTYGLDFIYTNPITERTINGGYEADDQTTEFGGYLQSETALSPKFDLVLAGRLDHHSALPEAIFSPRAALVFKPVEGQAFRLTYNRAFSTPSSLNQWLDLGSAIPNPGAAALGYSLRVQGTGKDGFHFRQADGSYLMRSPFTPGAMGGPAKLLPANAAMFWDAAVQVVAQQAGLGATPEGAALVSYLRGLSPSNNDIGTNYFHPQTEANAPLSELSLSSLNPIRESTTTTIEAGYKGVLGDRILLAADAWYSRKENMVTPLLIQTPFVMLNGAQTGAYLVPKLTEFYMGAGMPQEMAQATAVGTAQQLAPGLASVPLGVISSDDVHANGAQLLTTYINVDDHFDLYGLDLAATALLGSSWSLTGTLSLANENLFETKKGEQVTLNAPKTKGSIALGYRNITNGLNAEVRTRYNDAFPVRSGVYNGVLCLANNETERNKMIADGAEDCVASSTLMDLLVGYQLPIQGASIQLSVQNVLDEKYRSFPGVPAIGRMALVRLKYDF